MSSITKLVYPFRQKVFEKTQTEVEKEIVLSKDIKSAIASSLEKIFSRSLPKETGAMIRSSDYVFTLNSAPTLIFKAASKTKPEKTIERFKNAVMAWEACSRLHLNRLIVPHAKMFEVNGVVFIAEEKFDVERDVDKIALLYHQFPRLTLTIEDLAKFTGLGAGDIDLKNIPLYIHHGIPYVVLVDLGDMQWSDLRLKNATKGFFGGNYSRDGLLCCVTREQHIDCVNEFAGLYGISSQKDPEQISETRKDKFETVLSHLYYRRKGLYENPSQLVSVIPESLGLEPELRSAIVDVIEEINACIKKYNCSTPQERTFFFPSTEKWESYEKSGCLKRILDALLAKKELFRVQFQNERCLIQV